MINKNILENDDNEIWEEVVDFTQISRDGLDISVLLKVL